QWIVTDFFDNILACIASNPLQISSDLALVRRRLDVVITIPPNRVLASLNRFFIWFNGFAAGLFLDSDRARARAISRAAVTDAVIIAFHSLQDDRRARHGLGGGDKILPLE